MIIGRYSKGREDMPRVTHISIARYERSLPQSGKPLEFLLSVHEEGMGITWQQNITVQPEEEKQMLAAVDDLHLWSLNAGGTLKTALKCVRTLGQALSNTFIGDKGKEALDQIQPTAILLDVDETILNLPWELLTAFDGPISQKVPFGRLVTARNLPRRGRDPRDDDAVVRVLAITDPKGDLGASRATVDILKTLNSPSRISVDSLARQEATLGRFKEMVAAGDYDIIHFDGHASMDHEQPGRSGLVFADGVLTADEVLDLKWKEPPYLVFNSACESGRAAAGQRLVSRDHRTSGLPSAFLATGVYIYIGYFWPVTQSGANLFTKTFYKSLFENINVGIAFLEARNRSRIDLAEFGDLIGFSGILFGDSGGNERLSIAKV